MNCLRDHWESFLYHMVRRLVYVQVWLDKASWGWKTFNIIFKHRTVEPIQGLAPPQGLTLVEVSYPTNRAWYPIELGENKEKETGVLISR